MTTTDPIHFALRQLGIDRWRSEVRISGWLWARPGESYDIVASAPDASEQTTVDGGVSSDESRGSSLSPSLWSLIVKISGQAMADDETTLQLAVEPRAPNASRLCIELPLAEAVDLTENRLAVSEVQIDPLRERLSIRGWWAGACSSPRVRVLHLGADLGTVRMGQPRADLHRQRPGLDRGDLGWHFEGYLPPTSSGGSLEIRLEDGGAQLATIVRPVDAEAASDVRLKIQYRRLLAHVRRSDSERLWALLASKAFQKRWSSSEATGVAAMARQLIVEELIERGAAEGEVTVRTDSGDLITCNPSQDVVIARAFLAKGGYEIGFVRWVQSVVRAGDTVIDGGAAYGMISLAAARQGAQVVAVEASVETRRRLEQNLRQNELHDSVRVVGKALFDRPGISMELLTGSGNVGASRLIADTESHTRQKAMDLLSKLPILPWQSDSSPGGASAKPQDVKTTTLDHLCKSLKLRDVALLKLDIEGAELAALRGASRLLAGDFGVPPIVALEYSHIIPTIGGEPADVFRLFQGLGWSAWKLAQGKDHGGRPERIPRIEDAPYHDNVLFVPPGRLDRLGEMSPAVP